ERTRLVRPIKSRFQRLSTTFNDFGRANNPCTSMRRVDSYSKVVDNDFQRLCRNVRGSAERTRLVRPIKSRFQRLSTTFNDFGRANNPCTSMRRVDSYSKVVDNDFQRLCRNVRGSAERTRLVRPI